ncbi:phage tail tape measure protein [Acinetobacter haemolyticus]|uniref:cell wall hydrolase n=1 Tax=Acinetobacter haemolyticus TaxID=29430 RepID=UPI001331D7CE|nr:cell wall hydrolase [Acinetobacter haemolyticus]QHI29029.1 phage tail tape measure protein [Acinetobacter haemolyticus]
MAGGVIRDFLVSLGFDTDNSGLANMKSAMDGIEWKAKALNGALMALATGAVIAVRQTASELDKLYFSSQRIGASVTNINAYGNAIAQLGGSAEGAVGTLEALAEKIRNSPGYEGQIKSLGVNTRDANGAMRDRVEVMKDLSGVLSKMPAYQANAYANSLGIDQKTLLAMRDGKFMANMEKYQKIQKELGMNDDLAKSGNEFMTEYRDLTMMTKTGFQVIVMQAGKALIPILKLLNQLIQSGIQAFSQLNPQIKEGLAVGLRFAMLALMFGALAKSLGLLLKFIPAFKTFIGLLKLFRLAFLASPIGIILALGAALALLYDDYKTWREGGKSLFDWSKWTNGIDTIINKIKDFLDILDKIKDKTIEFVQKIIKDPAGALKEVATEVEKGVTKTAEKVNNAVDKYINPTDPNNVTPTQDKVAQVTDFIYGAVDKGLAVFGNTGAKTRVGQRERGEIGYQSAATGAAKAAVSAVKSAVKSGKELKLSEQDIVDIMKVASTEVVGSLKGKAFEQQAAGVIDTILNRTASGKYGKTLRDVVNQPYAFSDINSNQKTAYGSVQKVPMSRVSKRMEKFVREYLELRANGRASSVGLNVNYANPNFLGKANANTKKWVAEVDEQAKISGQRFGAGNAIHVHGTPSGDKHKMPKPFYISTPSTSSTPKGSIALAKFAQNAELPNIISFAPPTGNPHKSQINSADAMAASNIVINQNYQTDMTINGASSPVESANAIKRQQDNAMTIMARGAKGIFV